MNQTQQLLVMQIYNIPDQQFFNISNLTTGDKRHCKILNDRELNIKIIIVAIQGV